MANIKISELNELSTGADNDYLPIVDSSENETKKISLENLKEYNIGDLEELETEDKSSLINAINELKDSIDGVVESGTWTPVLKCVSGEPDPTYTTSYVRGKYRKIGDLLYIEFYIRGVITALNGTNNYVIIKGLPYNTSDLHQGQQALAKGIVYGILDVADNITFTPYDDGIRVQIYNGSGAAKYKVTTDSYFEIGGSGFYIANVNQ